MTGPPQRRFFVTRVIVQALTQVAASYNELYAAEKKQRKHHPKQRDGSGWLYRGDSKIGKKTVLYCTVLCKLMISN